MHTHWLIAFLLCLASVALGQDPFSGTWKNDKLTVEFRRTDTGAYVGAIRRGEQSFPLKATFGGGKGFHGTFTSEGAEFEFTAALSDSTLSFQTGQTVYQLKRQQPAGPRNPLDSPPGTMTEKPTPPTDTRTPAIETPAPLRETPTTRPAIANRQARFAEFAEAYNAKNYATAYQKVLPLATEGDAESQFMLGLMFQHGRGMQPSPADAAKWYQLATKQGHINARTNLGFLYKEGRGVERDQKKAVELFRASAEKGSDTAQLALGAAYINGEGVQQDAVEGTAWMMLSAAQRNTVAAENLKAIAPRLSQEQRQAAAQRAAALYLQIQRSTAPAAPETPATPNP